MTSFCRGFVAATAFICLVQGTTAHDQSPKLPIVDLGYELQQATYFNHTGAFYNFSNIRYAAPPVGSNRFLAPKPPTLNRTQVQTGSPDRICPQASTAWLGISEQFLSLYLGGQTEFNHSSFNVTPGGGTPPIDPRTTEDCLFLDVVVPQTVFESAGKNKPAPVLVWIYGGGYTTGSKTSWGNPAGLIRRSQKDGAEGVIYVSMNYRLGAFGWLSGPTFQEDGTANAGLYDQRAALEWVQKYIHLFGGDPKRVTVFGESAGGGSIMHQITAYGGKAPTLFQQAILQSPAFFPISGEFEQEQTFRRFLEYANVSSLDEARQLSTTVLQQANLEQVGVSPYGRYTYGPSVDGCIVPALPGLLMLHGEYAKDVNVMVGHNLNEGLLFTSPFIQNDSEFRKWVKDLIPTAQAYPAIVDHVTDVLYPAIFDGSQAQGYTDQISRAAAFVSEFALSCNTFYVNKAFDNNTYAYWFTVPPALHGLDIPYTYFNGPNPGVVDDSAAILLQEYITRFAETGTPNGPGEALFPKYGANATVQELNVTTSQRKDPAANFRCDWWQKALYS